MNTIESISKESCDSLPIEFILESLGEMHSEKEVMLNSLIKFYYKNDRHRYSLISKYILKCDMMDNSEKISVILINVDILITYCKENKKIIETMIEKHGFGNYTVDEFIKNFSKLNDHLELEVLRASEFYKRQEYLLNRKTEEFALSVDKTKDSLSKLEERLNTGFISILGIFAAIIIAFFGGISAVNNIFSGLINPAISSWKIIFFGCLSGVIVFNIIFMFLYFLSKFVGKNLCCRRSSNIDSSKSNIFKIMFYDYSFITTFNLVFIIIIGVSSWKMGLWW